MRRLICIIGLLITAAPLQIQMRAGSAFAHDLVGRKVQADQIAKMPANVAKELNDRGGPQFELTNETIINAKAMWPHHWLIKACFMGGAPGSRLQFISGFKEVITNTNLKLDESIEDCPAINAYIRVSFSEPGYWSYIGNEALLVPENVPTVNLQGMGGGDNWTKTQRGIAFHEIGHAVGLLHEHQHPDIDCKFVPFEQIAMALNWTVAEVQNNMQQIKLSKDIVVTAPDRKSIMHYQLPASYFQEEEKSPCYILKENTTLSDRDVEFLRQMYPKK